MPRFQWSELISVALNDWDLISFVILSNAHKLLSLFFVNVDLLRGVGGRCFYRDRDIVVTRAFCLKPFGVDGRGARRLACWLSQQSFFSLPSWLCSGATQLRWGDSSQESRSVGWKRIAYFRTLSCLETFMLSSYIILYLFLVLPKQAPGSLKRNAADIPQPFQWMKAPSKAGTL